MAVGGGGASSGAVRAGKAFVQMFLDDNMLTRGLGRLKSKFGSLSKSLAIRGGILTGIGGGVLGGLGKLVDGAVDNATEIGKLSSKLGIGTEKLSQFAHAAGRAGVNLQELEGHFENFAERVFQGANGTGEAANSFKRLGIDAAALQKLDQVEQMIALADAMRGVTNETERLGILSSFGGDQFQKLNDLFRQGPDAIRAYMAESDKFGATVTDEQVAAAKELNAAWTLSMTGIKSILLEVGHAFFGQSGNAMTLAQQIGAATAAARSFIKENRGVIQTVALVAGGVLAAGAGLLALSGVFAGLSTVIGAVLSVAGFLLSPAGLLIAGAAAGVAALFAYTDAWAVLKDTFSETVSTVTTGWGAITNALAGGDFSGAFKIAMSAVELEWSRLLLKLQEGWIDFKGFFVDGWHDAVMLVQVAFVDFIGFFQRQLGDVLKKFTGVLKQLNDATSGLLLGFGGSALLDAADAVAQGDPEKIRSDIIQEAQRAQAERDKSRAADLKAAKDRLAVAKQEFAVAVDAANAAAFMRDLLWNNATQSAGATLPKVTRGAPTKMVTAAGVFGSTVGGRQFARSSEDIAKKQLRAEQETAKNTAAIVDFFERGGAALVWGA